MVLGFNKCDLAKGKEDTWVLRNMTVDEYNLKCLLP